jgi:undecaprenyl-diphosphatase
MQERYKIWQERIKANKYYKAIVVFCGIYSVLLFVPLGIVLLRNEDGIKVIILCLVAVGIARGIVTEIIYYFYQKQRPYQSFAFDPVSSWLFSKVSKRGDSFPSGHTVSIVAASTVLYLFLPSYGLAGFLIAVMVGYGRVRLGNHYPVDILAGFIIGIACGFIAFKFATPLLFT